MIYKYWCKDCLELREIEVGNLWSFTCRGCGCTVDVYNENGIKKSFQAKLDEGIPKDKNGVEVRVGDIIRDERSRGTQVGVVEWEFDRGYTVLFSTKPEERLLRFCRGHLHSGSEIIGNIYMNPELLKPTNPINETE